MKRKRYSENQIILILPQQEAGRLTVDASACAWRRREHPLSLEVQVRRHGSL